MKIMFLNADRETVRPFFKRPRPGARWSLHAGRETLIYPPYLWATFLLIYKNLLLDLKVKKSSIFDRGSSIADLIEDLRSRI